MAVFRNEGELFESARLETINEVPEWSAEPIDACRRQLEEVLELREEEIEQGMSELETQYHWTSQVLRSLGYTFSVAELAPDTGMRPDFTLFYNADDFRTAVTRRGDREFFSQALAVVRCYSWTLDLDQIQLTDGPGDPGYEIDRMIRSTSVNWGILTNGRTWRLYHRDSSGLMSTFYEVDLLTALQAPGVEEFKYFWTIFSPEGLGGYDNNDPLTLRLLH